MEAGSAVITAAIYAARKKMNFAVVTKNIGGQVVLSPEVENYTGFQYIAGEELAKKFKEHLEVCKLEEARKVTKGFFKVKADKGAYQSKTVIMANG